MMDQSNCLILSVIPAKAGIQVKPNLNQLPKLFEKLLVFVLNNCYLNMKLNSVSLKFTYPSFTVLAGVNMSRLFISIQQKHQKWFELTRQERFILIGAMVLLPIVRIIRIVGFKRFKKFLSSLPVTSCKTGLDNKPIPESARQAARMVAVAASHIPARFSCLDRSLVLLKLLRQMGIDGELHLGVRKDRGIFEAHAWVELNGEILNDVKNIREQFGPFPSAIMISGHNTH